MSFSDDFLIFLSGYHSGYKLMRARMGGYSGPPELLFQQSKKEIKAATLRSLISRLKRRGLIERRGILWFITKKGKNYLEEKSEKRLPSHAGKQIEEQNRNKNKKKNMIIVFDIPETLRHKRDWLREELLGLGFIPLQKSVWIGPVPLPRTFIENLSHLNILLYTKFFRAREEEVVSL